MPPASFAAGVVRGDVAGNREKPGCHSRPTSEASRAALRFQECRLEQIRDFWTGFPQYATEEPGHTRGVSVEQRSHGGRITSRTGGEERLVGNLVCRALDSAQRDQEALPFRIAPHNNPILTPRPKRK